jgi:DNA-binding NarL/FixJ family response regulator
MISAQDPLVRSTLASRLGSRPELAVVAQAGTAAEARQAATPALDVILWDIGPSGQVGGWNLDRRAPPVLALVADGEAASSALAEGAQGVLFRERDVDALAPAILAVAQGVCVVEPELLEELRPSAPSPKLREQLTPREHEVLGLLALGMSNKTIAERLAISEHTAKFHVNSVLQKLGVDRRTEAVVRAVRLGLVVL